MKKYILSIFCLFFGFNEQPKYVQHAQNLSKRFIDKTCKDKNFFLEALGGSMMYQVQGFTFYFCSNKQVKLNEAREIFVSLVEELIKEVNTDKKLRPYLDHYPFTITGADIQLTFRNSNGSFASSNNIYFIFIQNNIIYYDIFNHETGTLENFYSEKYEEAIKKLSNLNNF